MTPAFWIVSAIPGRVRVRIAHRVGREFVLNACVQRVTGILPVTRSRVSVGAASIVFEYDRKQSRLESFLTQLQIAVADAIKELDPSSASPFSRIQPIPSARTPKAARNGHSVKAAAIAVLYSIPGRLSLHIPRLRAHHETAASLKNDIGNKKGVHAVEVHSDNSIVLVRYNPCIHQASAVLRSVRRVMRLMTQSPSAHRDIVRVRDIPSDGEPSVHPLLLPSLAIVSALTGVLPSVLTAMLVAAAALPIATRAFQGLRDRKPNVDQLDFVALGVLAVMGDLITGSLMTWLIGLGDLIRAMTMRRSHRAISELMSPAGQTAWVERDGAIISRSVQELEAGDCVLVYPGDQIPVDGVIVSGRAFVDMKILTGESAPVSRSSGEKVFALTTVMDGQISVRVEHIGKETRAGQVAAMIEDAPLSDTRIQNYASLIGDNLVLPIFGLAALTYVFTGDLLRMAAVLILDFATGIRVSAPTTILSAMTSAARHGLFIKGGKSLEKLAEVNAVVFDKTGTLTRGEPFVSHIHSLSDDFPEEEVLRLAASAEANLKHPAAQAIVEAARSRGIEVSPPSEMEYSMGLGVATTVEGKPINVGSERYLRQSGVDMENAAELIAKHTLAGNSLVYVAAEGMLIGLLAYSDPVRPESFLVLQALRDRGVTKIVMLTGDNACAAQLIADELGISDVIADAFPEQKADVVQALREDGYIVAVIGDGVNDSPAFTRADIGISLAHGADVARETADMILLDSNLWGLPRAIDLARNAMGILNQNLNIVIGPTGAGLVASVFGLANPLISTLINNGTTVLAGINALRPLGYQSHADLPSSRHISKEATIDSA